MALDISVEGTREVHEGSEYVLYQMRVSNGQWNQLIEKRYSQFLELHRVMKMRYHSSHLDRKWISAEKSCRSFQGRSCSSMCSEDCLRATLRSEEEDWRST